MQFHAGSDPVWVVKHANRWGILKIEKLHT
jgi:hypothetical protein